MDLKDFEPLSRRLKNIVFSLGLNSQKVAQRSASVGSFGTTKRGLSRKIMVPCSIRLVEKAPHPFPSEGFNSNGALLWIGRPR